MKAFILTLLLTSTLSISLYGGASTELTSESDPQGLNLVVFPESMIEVVQENCGNFESWASEVVSHYGGADGELSEKEFLVAY